MSSGRCWSSDTYNPVPGVMEGVPSGNNYQGGFGTQLMAKVRRCPRLSTFFLFEIHQKFESTFAFDKKLICDIINPFMSVAGLRKRYCTVVFNLKCNYFVVFPSRISDLLRTQPQTQRLLSLSVPWPIRFTAWCAHVVMPVKISPPFFSSCVRRKGNNNVGFHHTRPQRRQFLTLHRTRTAGCILPWGLWLFFLFFFFFFFFQVVREPGTRALLSFSESHHWSFLIAALPFNGTKEVFHRYVVYNENTILCTYILECSGGI